MDFVFKTRKCGSKNEEFCIENDEFCRQTSEVGPHNVYNIYDNCPRSRAFLEKSGLTPYQLNAALRGGMNTGGIAP